MDKLNNSEDAKQFLRGLRLQIDEAVVRQVVNVLCGKSQQTLYSLYTTRPGKPLPVCGKGSVYKIKTLYDKGELQPFLDYLSQWPNVDEAEAEQIKEAEYDVPKESRTEQVPYEETPHKQKMRELAEEVAKYLSLPHPLFNPITKYPPLPELSYEIRSFSKYDNSRLTIIAKTIDKWVRTISESHIYAALFSHLRTSDLSDTVDKIDEWMYYASDGLLLQTVALFNDVEKDLKQESNIRFCYSELPGPDKPPSGIVPNFIMTICNCAIEGTEVDISRYWMESHALTFDEDIISYEGSSDNSWEVMNIHIELINKYIEDDLTKHVRTMYKRLRAIEKDVRPELLKFKDMERLPGWCELCK